ncbi:MAG: nucleotidyltransferase family protein [Vicinamibacterales bacterium]
MAILAGGLATRLRPMTTMTPKSMVDVAGRPFIEHQLGLLRTQGLTDVILLVGHLGEVIRDALGDGARLGVRLEYAFDGPRPLGTGGAILHALPLLGDAFFVLYGDSYLACNYREVAKAFETSGALGLMTVYPNEDQWDRSNVEFADGRIIRYDKRRRWPRMRHIDYGLGMLRPAAFAGRIDGEAFDLADVYIGLLGRGALAGLEVTTRFYEIGSPSGLEETRQLLGSLHE